MKFSILNYSMAIPIQQTNNHLNYMLVNGIHEPFDITIALTLGLF